jgi:hypothetical protein
MCGGGEEVLLIGLDEDDACAGWGEDARIYVHSEPSHFLEEKMIGTHILMGLLLNGINWFTKDA